MRYAWVLYIWCDACCGLLFSHCAALLCRTEPSNLLWTYQTKLIQFKVLNCLKINSVLHQLHLARLHSAHITEQVSERMRRQRWSTKQKKKNSPEQEPYYTILHMCFRQKIVFLGNVLPCVLFAMPFAADIALYFRVQYKIVIRCCCCCVWLWSPLFLILALEHFKDWFLAQCSST